MIVSISTKRAEAPLCQSCFIKSNLPEDSFKLGAYEPGHPELDNDGVAAAGANQASRPPGGVQQQEVASQGRTEPNSGQGWSMPSAPPNYSDLPNGGSGVSASSLNPNDAPDLPPPSYEDAMKNADTSGNNTAK